MLLSACILIFCWTQCEHRRAGILLSSSRHNGQTAQWPDPTGSAEALQSSLSWHPLSWSTQGPQEAAAKQAVICSTWYLLQRRLQAERRKDCTWPDGPPGTCLSALSWSVATPEIVDFVMVLVSKTIAVINSISLVKN